MALFSTVPESGELQARVAEELLAMRGIAYAQISPQLDIVDLSPSFYTLLQEPAPPVEGKAIAEVCWEFFGLEATLEKILQGELADFYLPDINRTQLDGTVRYYDFSIMPLLPLGRFDSQPCSGYGSGTLYCKIPGGVSTRQRRCEKRDWKRLSFYSESAAGKVSVNGMRARKKQCREKRFYWLTMMSIFAK